MEQRVKNITVDLQLMEREDLIALRKSCSAEIAARIREINLINIELNGRLNTREVLPEFGKPIVALGQLSIEGFPDGPQAA